MRELGKRWACSKAFVRLISESGIDTLKDFGVEGAAVVVAATQKPVDKASTTNRARLGIRGLEA